MLHFTSIHSPISSVTANLTLPLDTGKEVSNLPWQRDILQHQALFSANYELDGNAVSRNWGITASAYGELLATCITLHPTDQIHYAIAADQFCQITLTLPRDADQGYYFAHNCHVQGNFTHTLTLCCSYASQI